MNNWGEMYKYRNGCPSVIWVAHVGHILLGKLMKFGGPIGEFLYEVKWPPPCDEIECQGDDKTSDKLCQRRDKVNKFRG